MHDHQQCLQLFEKLSEYIDRELDQSACDEIERHLKQCEPCQACLHSLRQTVALCRKLDTTEMPETFSQRLRQMVAQYS